MAVTVPDWADTMLDLIGINWPNVDEDAYRDMADALREFADDVEDDGHLANQHVQRLLSSGSGEALDALNGHWGKVKNKHVKDLASGARTIAGALDNAATAIEAMKYAAIVHLGVLAGKAGISMALIPVTGGLSMLIGGAAIAVAQQAIRRVIKECMEEVVGYIVSALTEPAVAALENMAADL
ncbi:type IV secretion protein Rhs, partial [Streptomyces globisporus]|uniref:WXG100 family type VII secretion target n=1 Tax=Streptomyces globisporus TaxID=1908 RepID=UPI00348EF98B